MSNNREQRVYKDVVHLYLALYREGTSKDKRCMRQVIKDEVVDLKIIEAKCKALGGNWRIHKTVNARKCNEAMKVLQKILIDHPEKASVIDSEWRTALLQRSCRDTNYFMLDIDTQEEGKIWAVESLLFGKVEVLGRYKSPKGWHYITKPFDTREICNLDYVTLVRDGYYFIKEVHEDE